MNQLLEQLVEIRDLQVVPFAKYFGFIKPSGEFVPVAYEKHLDYAYQYCKKLGLRGSRWASLDYLIVEKGWVRVTVMPDDEMDIEAGPKTTYSQMHIVKEMYEGLSSRNGEFVYEVKWGKVKVSKSGRIAENPVDSNNEPTWSFDGRGFRRFEGAVLKAKAQS